MPSRSPTRGGRVVYETDRRMPGSRSSRARTRLVLPPPDGAATTKRLPRTAARVPVPAAASLNILHLLAHLLDEDLQLERGIRKLGVDGFRAEGVRFAVQLLHQEVEPLAAAAARGEHASHFRDVSAKPTHLL